VGPVILVTQVVWVLLVICRFTRVHKRWLRRRTGCYPKRKQYAGIEVCYHRPDDQDQITYTF
jgi:hypothetical protein